jgi:hypothetical protein
LERIKARQHRRPACLENGLALTVNGIQESWNTVPSAVALWNQRI